MREHRQGRLDLFAPPKKPPVLSVSELTREVKSLIERGFNRIWVVGEVSGLRRQSSGHVYLTLKDDGAALQAVCFKSSARKIGFNLKDGMEVLAAGSLSVYMARGQYQFIIDHIEPKGLGALQAAFEELKAKLNAEGLFNKENKKHLPKLPKRIGVVTSPTGAAIHDFLRVLTRRNPYVSVLIAPAKVQGEGSAEEIATQLARLDARGDLDVLVLTRGGGSIEDLWAFNEELLARAIAKCSTPVVSAVGHEVDVTISDLVADFRAPTPSAAAEVLAPDHLELVRTLRSLRDRIGNATFRRLEQNRALLMASWGRAPDPRRSITDRRLELEGLRERMESSMKEGLRSRDRKITSIRSVLDRLHPRTRLQALRKPLIEKEKSLVRLADRNLRSRRSGLQILCDRLNSTHPRRSIEKQRTFLAGELAEIEGLVARDLSRARRSHAELAGKLDALSPLRVLERGYSLVTKMSGAVLRSSLDVQAGEDVSIRLAKGSIMARVIMDNQQGDKE